MIVVIVSNNRAPSLRIRTVKTLWVRIEAVAILSTENPKIVRTHPYISVEP